MMWGQAWDGFAPRPRVWWVLVIGAIVAVLRWRVRRARSSQDRATTILRERYARGGIDKAEFKERQHDLVR